MDSNKPNAVPTKEEPLLTQNKIPSEMLASYQPQSDFEVTNLLLGTLFTLFISHWPIASNRWASIPLKV